MLEKIHLSSSEGLPLNVPYSVSKMRVADDYFVFKNGTNVLLMDRLDGSTKRTFCINSSDFVLDSSNDRIIAAKLGKLVCFGFEGETFEISISNMKNFELVDFVNDKFMFYDANSFCLYF